MQTIFAVTLFASVLTAVADWAGWNFVWKHENSPDSLDSNKHSPTNIFLSYYLPFMPSLALILGPSVIGLYNAAFEEVASTVLYAVMVIFTGGLSASCWNMRKKQNSDEPVLERDRQKEKMPEHATQHIFWTTTMLVICCFLWIYLLIQ